MFLGKCLYVYDICTEKLWFRRIVKKWLISSCHERLDVYPFVYYHFLINRWQKIISFSCDYPKCWMVVAFVWTYLTGGTVKMCVLIIFIEFTDWASWMDWYCEDWYFEGACPIWPWLVLYQSWYVSSSLPSLSLSLSTWDGFIVQPIIIHFFINHFSF